VISNKGSEPSSFIVNSVVEKQRVLQFYISLENGCNVGVNDTVVYENPLDSPIEHVIENDNVGNMFSSSAKGVYSKDVDIDYYGHSSKIKTFSTYFSNPKDHKDSKGNSAATTRFEYIYEARNLIHSFSDFRDGASYNNLTRNYNAMSWMVKNENENKHSEVLAFEIYFDLGHHFVNETSFFNTNMSKSIIEVKGENNSTKTIVKYKSLKDLILNYNQTYILNLHFPLYFENCKNYRLNLLISITGYALIGLLVLIIYRTICVIAQHEVEDVKK
jgi:hypothetical protein